MQISVSQKIHFVMSLMNTGMCLFSHCQQVEIRKKEQGEYKNQDISSHEA